MSLRDLTQKRAKLAAELAALDAEIAEAKPRLLAALPAAYGFKDLPSFCRALRAACRVAKQAKRPRTPRKRTRLAPVKAVVKAAPAVVSPPVVPEPPRAAEPAAVMAPASLPAPAGNSLADPANFSLRPDLGLLSREGKSQQVFREELAKALAFARQVLHTSKVPAKVWADWRQFERAAEAELQRG